MIIHVRKSGDFNEKIGYCKKPPMSQLALDQATLFIKESYQHIAPDIFPPVEYYCGRQLNANDEAEPPNPHTTSDGHRIVCVNEIFEDSEGNKYRVIDILGNGTYSYVFKCQVVSDPTTFVALKVIKNQIQYRETGLSEMMIHHTIDEAAVSDGKDNIVSPLSTFDIDGHICMVLPLYQRSLFDGIGQDKAPMIILSSIRSICLQLLNSLKFIHSMGIVHCDVKPDNIMYTSEICDHICLIDFGSATKGPYNIGQYIQSRFYRSPEIMLGLPYSSQIDLWSVGCIAAELYLDFSIFACDNESDSIHSMVALLGPIEEQLLSNSRGWWKFYDYGQNGYTLKMDPQEVLLQNHLYHETVFQPLGPITLHQMIIEHFPLNSESDINNILVFSDFVHSLLVYDQDVRLTAEKALSHPFITGEHVNENEQSELNENEQPDDQQMELASNTENEITEDFVSMF